jgi:hypothetical protein
MKLKQLDWFRLSGLTTAIVQTNIMDAKCIKDNEFVVKCMMRVNTAFTNRVAKLDAKTEILQGGMRKEYAGPFL